MTEFVRNNRFCNGWIICRRITTKGDKSFPLKETNAGASHRFALIVRVYAYLSQSYTLLFCDIFSPFIKRGIRL